MRLLTKAVAVIAVAGCILSASALNLTLNDAYYLGCFRPGHPAGPDPVTAYLNHLIGMDVGETETGVVIGSYAAQTLVRSGNFDTPLPEAVWAEKDDSSPQSAHSAAYLYITAKYDSTGGGTAVWYLGELVGIDSVKVPKEAFGSELSSVNLFNSTAPPVPDGGTTAMLFGIALSSAALLRRKLG